MVFGSSLTEKLVARLSARLSMICLKGRNCCFTNIFYEKYEYFVYEIFQHFTCIKNFPLPVYDIIWKLTVFCESLWFLINKWENAPYETCSIFLNQNVWKRSNSIG